MSDREIMNINMEMRESIHLVNYQGHSEFYIFVV